MSAVRLVLRSVRPVFYVARPVSTSTARYYANASEREHDTTPAFRETQKNKPLGPHMTNTTSTIANEMPSVGADKAPPELLTSVDPDFVPKDSAPENTERMTGGTQEEKPSAGSNSDLGVGEMEGAKFKVEPLRRTGEDGNTMRARLLCPSFNLRSLLFRNIADSVVLLYQTRVGRGEPSKVTSYSPLLPTPISHT